MTKLWVDLQLSEDAKLVSSEDQHHIYNEFMSKLEQECVADLTELFLERSDLFDQSSALPNDASFRIHLHQELKVSYKPHPLTSLAHPSHSGIGRGRRGEGRGLRELEPSHNF